MVKEFFALQGFQKVSEKEDGAAEWLLDLSISYARKNQVILVNSKEKG